MDFKIDSGVDIPSKVATKYPFSKMKVGDSIYFSKEFSYLACMAAYNYGAAHGMKFVTRKENDGKRIWRVK